MAATSTDQTITTDVGAKEKAEESLDRGLHHSIHAAISSGEAEDEDAGPGLFDFAQGGSHHGQVGQSGLLLQSRYADLGDSAAVFE